MKVVFKHKDQEFFNEVCKLLPSFAKRFQKACEEQWDDPTDYVYVPRDCCDTSFHWCFDIPKRDIERVEELKPFVWYPASKWNGNPQKHSLVERAANGHVYSYNITTQILDIETKFFMFVPKDKDIKPC